MRIQITTRHCEVPEDVRARAHAQLEALGKFDPRLAAADVVFTEERVTRNVEVILSVDGAPPIVGHGEAPEFGAAVEQVVDRVGRMLRKRRQREMDHQAPPLSERTPGT